MAQQVILLLNLEDGRGLLSLLQVFGASRGLPWTHSLEFKRGFCPSVIRYVKTFAVYGGDVMDLLHLCGPCFSTNCQPISQQRPLLQPGEPRGGPRGPVQLLT